MNKSASPLILFPLCPTISFLLSVSNLQNKLNRIVFVLYFGLFGFCHTFTDTRADSYRKYLYFRSYQPHGIKEIFDNFFSGNTKDVYEPLLFNWIKSFSDDPKVMMMFVGLIGGFFYLRVMMRFMADKISRLTYPIIILLAFMFIESNICLMGGIRNFTAFPIFIYSVIRIFLDKKRSWFIGLLLTPLIHFGYILPVIAFIFIFLFRLPNKMLHYIAILACAASIFLSTSSYTKLLSSSLEYVDNNSMSYRMEHYGDNSTEEHFSQSLTTNLIRINNKISACFIIVLLFYIRKYKTQLIQTEYEMTLYKLLLFFIIIGFALISFSVVGQRYVYIGMVLLYLFLLNIYQNNSRLVAWAIYVMPFLYSLHIAWFLYNCYCNVGVDILYQPVPLLFM